MIKMLFSDKEILQSTRDAVNSAVSLKRLPQCVLITGGSEALRNKCALELAASALCKESASGFPCNNCSGCRKAFAGIHPDMFRIVPEDGKKLLSVKTVRENCLARLFTAPTEAENKVFLLSDCDNLSVVVQNALLKSIEEPPDDTMFILCAEGREGLLTTVISRLTEYPLGDPLSAKGRKTDDAVNEVADNIALALANEDEFAVMMACSPMHKNRKMMSSVAARLILIIRDALAQGSGTPLLSGSDMASYALSRSYRTSSLLQIKEVMDKIISDAAMNANENLLISKFSSDTAKIMKDRI